MTASIFTINLDFTQQHIYVPCRFDISSTAEALESDEYGAGTYEVNGLKILVRTAKITPKKIGQFVAIWQRDEDGITQPQHVDGEFDLMVINCQCDEKSGQFIFDKASLVKHGIISSATKRGKNGIRVYPAWDTAINKQAVKTQNWQLDYFLTVDENIDLARAKQLYSA